MKNITYGWAFIALVGVLQVLQGLHIINIDAFQGMIYLRWAALYFAVFYGWQTKKELTYWILLSMFIGAEIGYDFPALGKELDVLSKIFMKLIKCIIAPLLFGTLVTGIAGHSDMKQVGRMGIKSLIYFEVVTTLALIIGLVMINWTKAGEGIKLPDNISVTDTISVNNLAFQKTDSKIKIFNGKSQLEVAPLTVKQTWKEIVLHTFPENIAKSIGEGQVLQIVVFCILFAFGVMRARENHKRSILNFAEALTEIMFNFTKSVMKFAPFGVGGAMAYTISKMGLDVFKNLAMLVGTLYLALFVFIIFVLLPIALFIKLPIRKFMKHVAEPASLAFATASSEAALASNMSQLKKFGLPEKVISFVLPTGYTFNLDGTTLYLSLAAVFVAQAAGIHLSIQQQIIMGLTLILTSKGVAGVARASLIILAATAASFDLPEWPIAAIMGVDALMDMARTSVNVIGNSLAAVVIAKWEGEWSPEETDNLS
jgi:proton glutamate symport protein